MSENSYVMRPLGAGDPACPPNVAIISAPSCREALAGIFNAVAGSKDVNAAVWIDGTPEMANTEQARLAAWCQDYGLSTGEPLLLDKADGFRALRRIFNHAASGDQLVLAPFEAHIRRRLEALAEVFPDKVVRLTVRAQLLETRMTSARGGNPHIDAGGNIVFRFIETLAGGATCLIDNAQVRFGGSFDSIAMKDEAPVLWQVPEGALTYLSSLNNNRKPVMHCAPPQEEIGDGNTRIVVIYDLVARKPSFLARIAGLVR